VAGAAHSEAFRVLVFSKTAGFRHGQQIAAGTAALTRLAVANDFAVDFSEDESVFAPANLGQYAAVVFLFTSGDVLEPAAESAFEDFIRAGGGFVGVHSATDTEYQWSFYGELLGAYFAGHPAVQTATVVVVDGSHPSTAHLPASFEHSDEWYNFNVDPSAKPNVRVLLEVDESTYSGGTMGDSHPIAWTHELGGARMWYTAMGHTLLADSDYQTSFFDQHLLGGLRYAAVPEPKSGTATAATLLTLALLRCAPPAYWLKRLGNAFAASSLLRMTGGCLPSSSVNP
jgi:type 1 glutamine amidotransferase